MCGKAKQARQGWYNERAASSTRAQTKHGHGRDDGPCFKPGGRQRCRVGLFVRLARSRKGWRPERLRYCRSSFPRRQPRAAPGVGQPTECDAGRGGRRSRLAQRGARGSGLRSARRGPTAVRTNMRGAGRVRGQHSEPLQRHVAYLPSATRGATARSKLCGRSSSASSGA